MDVEIHLKYSIDFSFLVIPCIEEELRFLYFKDYHEKMWLTGFKPAEINSASDLKMEIEITLKDFEMRDAFIS